MRILVIGASGMLGSDLVVELVKRKHEVEAPSSKEFDILNLEHMAGLAMSAGKYDWCVNCAAYTAVDKAESEPQQATELNTLGPAYLANACGIGGVKFIHISTDFVFDGQATAPYEPDDQTNPLGVYGRTKRDGELAIREANQNAVIVRTSWLYGPNGKSFPRTMIAAWGAGKSLRVVDDQVGCPTYTADLARVLADMIQVNVYPGTYHACSSDAMTWHRVAISAIEAWNWAKGCDKPVEIEAIPTEAYPTPAKRPIYSVLNCELTWNLGIQPMRPTENALAEFVTRLDL